MLNPLWTLYVITRTGNPLPATGKGCCQFAKIMSGTTSKENATVAEVALGAAGRLGILLNAAITPNPSNTTAMGGSQVFGMPTLIS